MPGLKREQQPGEGRRQREAARKINGDVRSTFLRADVGSFHLPRAPEEIVFFGVGLSRRSQPRHEIFAC